MRAWLALGRVDADSGYISIVHNPVIQYNLLGLWKGQANFRSSPCNYVMLHDNSGLQTISMNIWYSNLKMPSKISFNINSKLNLGLMD